jgi:hypothetical protein
MNRRLQEQPQPTSPMNETAQAVWVDSLAEIIVAVKGRDDASLVSLLPVSLRGALGAKHGRWMRCFAAALR